jgi:hypothetical protein
MGAAQIRDREDKIDPMWSADEDERRLAIIKRAAAGARKALAAKSKPSDEHRLSA